MQSVDELHTILCDYKFGCADLNDQYLGVITRVKA